jgi:PPM family protein phosphatase
VRTTWGSATDRGLVREVNEDSLIAYPPVFLVADGMGGHEAGAEASRLVVEEFAQLAGQRTATPDEVHACFRRTADRLGMDLNGTHAGTTVAGVAVTAFGTSSYWLVFNIGDSRVYRLSAGALEQITVDHSVVQELVERGELSAERAHDHPDRHVITRVLSATSRPEPDYWLIPAGEHDRLLICSDGLTTELDDDVILRGLGEERSPQEASAWLVGQAVAAGGRDNVSVVVVDVATGDDEIDLAVTARRDSLLRQLAETWGSSAVGTEPREGHEGETGR